MSATALPTLKVKTKLLCYLQLVSLDLCPGFSRFSERHAVREIQYDFVINDRIL